MHSEDVEAVESIVPGVLAAYNELRATNGMGIYTSNGAFYNHTLFARDATMSAKFVSDFDHEVVKETIVALGALQGVKHDARTQEEFGRIHHEFRDFDLWKGRWNERLALRFMGTFWGARQKQIQTYYAADTTANYIRLINKFDHHIDRSFLDFKLKAGDGTTITVAESLTRAADWIVQQLDADGRFLTTRSRWSLPYQTFQDSLTAYAWNDGHPAAFRRPHSFVEVQAYGADALEDVSKLLTGRSKSVGRYREAAHTMRQALLRDFWSDDDEYFCSVLSERDGELRRLDVPNISAAWTLNASWWDELPQYEREAKISSIVNRLFSDEFLTDVGLRTRSNFAHEPLGDSIDYHGAQTVWPMFNFMVIEGLRRHRMYELAEQLERRIVNGANALGKYDEFFMVSKQGELYEPHKNRRLPKVRAQMIPERNIAFTIVPLLTIARRTGQPAPREPKPWHAKLEASILARIPNVPLMKPAQACDALQPRSVHVVRTSAIVRSVLHIRRGGV